MDDLLKNLRALAKGKHDDFSVAYDAIEEITRLKTIITAQFGVQEMTKPEHISLRDYFAVHAVNGVLANPEYASVFSDTAELAQWAYRIADMMVKLSAEGKQNE